MDVVTMEITKHRTKEHSMSIYEFFHFSLFPGLFLAFTYSKKQPPAFGAAPAYWSILLSFLGLLFNNLGNNLCNYNVLNAKAPFFYQISGTWSNHEGSLLLWCWIPNLYGFLLCYRSQPQSLLVQRGAKKSLLWIFASNFVKGPFLAGVEQSSGLKFRNGARDRSLVDSEVHSGRNLGPLHTSSQRAPMDGCYRGSGEIKRMSPLLHRVRNYEERGEGESLDSRGIDGLIGIALFFSAFLVASSDPFVRNFFGCTSPLSELNPVLQDPISAIHPPCIYAGEVASAVGFSLCRASMMNGIVAHNSRPMRQGDKKVTVFCSSVCVGSGRNVKRASSIQSCGG